MPVGHVEGVLLQILGGHVVQVVVDVLQQALDGVLQTGQRYEGLFAGIAASHAALLLLHVLGADLHTQRHALHLILGKLPACGLLAVVHGDTETGGGQTSLQRSGGGQHAGQAWHDAAHNNALTGGGVHRQALQQKFHLGGVLVLGAAGAGDHAGRERNGAVVRPVQPANADVGVADVNC